MSTRRDGDGTETAPLDERVVSRLTEEAKAEWLPRAPGADAARDAEDKLFARMDAHDASANAATANAASDSRFWGGVAAITALAAGVLLAAYPHGPAPSAQNENPGVNPGLNTGVTPEPAPARPTAPALLTTVTGGGELRVDGVVAGARGASLSDGQTAESHGGVAVFAAPGRVDWLLENGTEVSSVRAGSRGGAIVLALRVGAVEAQVTPVPAGEAFAVDVDGVRVAVHGTHLRVARESRGGSHVVVDLSEGVILVGAPPKAGATVGTMVTAPAHVEFSVADLEGTLRVDHDPSHVRTPVDPASLAEHAEALPSGTTLTASPPHTPAGAGAAPRAATIAAPSGPTPTEIIMDAVRSCSDRDVGERLRAGTVPVTINSTLSIDVAADGVPSLARFDPPLVRELQDCISLAVYRTRWSEPGSHAVPIELHR